MYYADNYYYYYDYVYEAKSFIGNIGFTIPDGFDVILTLLSILLGLAAFALVLFTAISVKRARPFGIVVAIAQPAGFIAAALAFINYAKIDFSSLVITVTGNSEADAMNRLYEAMGNAFIDNIMPQFIGYMMFITAYQVVTILTLIYYIQLIKAPKGKALAIVAMILTIIRMAVIGPIETMTLFLEASDFGIQLVWNMFFNFIFFLPVLLIAILGILNLVHGIKMKKMNAEAAQYAPAEAAPAVNQIPDRCPACGSERRADMAFCPECGHKF